MPRSDTLIAVNFSSRPYVLRNAPRGGAVLAPNPIMASNVPAIAANPAAGDRIEITGTTMRVPD
jgi:hydroxybutyrate-dimer hydrolase